MYVENYDGYIPDDGMMPCFAIIGPQIIPAFHLFNVASHETVNGWSDAVVQDEYVWALSTSQHGTVPFDQGKYVFKDINTPEDRELWLSLLTEANYSNYNKFLSERHNRISIDF